LILNIQIAGQNAQPEDFANLQGFVHITPQKFENARFISTLRPIVHTNPSRKFSFSKMLFKPEEFENAGF